MTDIPRLDWTPPPGEESLHAAFRRLGIRPHPPLEALKAMTAEERLAAIAASSVTREQYPLLPEWFRARNEAWTADLAAQRDAQTTD